VSTVVALLRAVNVGTANRIKMVDLRAAFVTAGYADAVTHIQTGNVIFASTDEEAVTVQRVEALINTHLGLNVRAIIRTGSELAAVAAANPFLGGDDEDTKHLYVSFLDHAPSATAVAALAAIDFDGDEFDVVGRNVFLRYRAGAGTTKLSNSVIEKKLGVVSTARNWNVTATLATLAAR
jgi:uncharacterized protein (DUF1697 family)